MDWTSVLLALLSGTTLAGIVEAIRYWRENKQLKANEVKVSDVNTEREQMSLADDYLKKVKDMAERIYSATLNNGKGNANILEKVDGIAAEQKRQAEETSNIVNYLNGDYQKYLKRQARSKTPKTPKS